MKGGTVACLSREKEREKNRKQTMQTREKKKKKKSCFIMKWGACYFLEMEFLTFSFFRSPFKNACTFFFGRTYIYKLLAFSKSEASRAFLSSRTKLSLKIQQECNAIKN